MLKDLQVLNLRPNVKEVKTDGPQVYHLLRTTCYKTIKLTLGSRFPTELRYSPDGKRWLKQSRSQWIGHLLAFQRKQVAEELVNF